MNAPQEIIDFLKLREGVKSVVYLDTKRILSGGVGHKLLPEDHYKRGDSVPDSVVNAWLEADSAKAYEAALEQANELGVTNEHFIMVLTSVNFQLGTSWRVNFAQTWTMLLAHEWDRAAKNLAHSLWAKQTPVRAQDFQAALYALANPNPEEATA